MSERFNTRLPVELKQWLARHAAGRRLSQNAVIILALEWYRRHQGEEVFRLMREMHGEEEAPKRDSAPA